MKKDSSHSRVAIIGSSHRFPGGNDFVENLFEGRDLISEVEASRWPLDTYRHPNKKQPGASYTTSAGSLGDISGFDAGFFGISPREAAAIDPQQRLLLELCWEALENAGVKPSTIRGSNSGVFIGISSSDYAFRLLDDLPAINSSVATGTTASIAANRISYVFDLCGPSMAIDTACSSSLVAFHQACLSILSGESEMAITGGVSLHIHPYSFIIFSKASMLSPRGRCHVFDKSGDGYVRSEGAGIFLLKNYDLAIEEGDPILAVVAASAVNTDGHKSGLTVPKADAQANLLRRTYDSAGINPSAIDYIEAHGTGTAVGDPIETRAIGEALGVQRSKDDPLPIGSVKSNLGHLEPASGAAGMAKALACIQRREIPATIGIQALNPAIQFEDWNLQVVTQNQPLPRDQTITIGINSFGFGGANAHVILQSHERQKTETKAPDSPPPLILSAKNEEALTSLAETYAEMLTTASEDRYYRLAYSSIFHRDWLEQRLLIAGENPQDIANKLLRFSEKPSAPIAGLATVTAPVAANGPAFIYSGNGSQWFAMGKSLLKDPVFQRTVKKIDRYFQPLAGYSLESELAGLNGDGRFEFTEIAQPALFAIQVGITEMLRHQDIRPVAVAGHSVGEVAAAWSAGILTLADAVQVIYHRSQQQGATKGKGQMTAVALGETAAIALLDELGLSGQLVIAGVNSANGITLAGDRSNLTQIESVLTDRAVRFKRLDLDYAFHSTAMDSIKSGIELALSGIKHQQAEIPFYSTVSGERLDKLGPATAYWWRNIRRPVLFERAVHNIIAGGSNLFIEIGPQAILSGYLNEILRDRDQEGRVISTLTRDEYEPDKIVTTCQQALLSGAAIDWKRYFPHPAPYTPLPNYPWQKERHWIQSSHESLGTLERTRIHPLLGYSIKQLELCWENHLDSLVFPMLGDHVVGESTVFPGTGYAELAVAAALAWRPEQAVVDIEELEILAPLLLSESGSKSTRSEIDPADGAFITKSRGFNSDEPWTLNAKGRILPTDQGLLLSSLNALATPSREPDFNGAGHLALLTNAGLDYGPSFQCVEQGWLEDRMVQAQLLAPDSIAAEVEQMHLHPALLDCTFQLIIHFLHKEQALYQGVVFVPAKIGRLSFRVGSHPPKYVQARLLHRSPHSLTAEFSLFDGDGEPVARISEARFRSLRLESHRLNKLDLLEFHGIPKPHPQAPVMASPLQPEDVQQEIDEVLKRRLLQGIDHHYAEEVEPLLDSFSSQMTLETLQQLASSDGQISLQTLSEYKGQSPDTALYLDYLLDSALDDQSIRETEAGWQLVPPAQKGVSARTIWNILLADYPDYFPLIHTLGRVGLNLRDILAGKTALTEIGSANASISIPIGHTLGSQRQQEIGGVIRNLIEKGKNQLADGQRLSLLEVSHQPPLFTMDVCLSMDFECCDYLYVSDLSESIEEAQRYQEHYPDMDCLLLQEEPEETPVAQTRCQLAIVTLDYDAIGQAQSLLAYARERLSPGGALLLIGQQPTRWLDFALGSTPGWFQTVDNQRLSSQKPLAYWKQQIQRMGLVFASEHELSPESLSDIYLLTARREEADNPPPPRIANTEGHWIFVTDRTGTGRELAQQLQTRLQAKGYQSSLLFSDALDQTEPTIRQMGSNSETLQGIVDLCGFQDSSRPQYAPAQAAAHRCGTITQLAQILDKNKLQTSLWIITAGAAWDLNKNPITDKVPADAAVRGFARTLINESSTFTVRLLDLGGGAPTSQQLTGLIRELDQPDQELEITLTDSGSRYAPRLRHAPDAEATDTPADGNPSARLQFQFPGQLRNLRWETVSRADLGGDEVEIAVHATGLNFRDLMYALGLLSDEAVENGFAGPSLGLEFAGAISRIGSESSGFRPGDKVVGFGPSSFADHVVTKATAISHIPPQLSFESAATIPSVFFTVYYALHHLARLQPGEKVLIHGAAGGIGIAAIQLAKHLGAEIFATAGSEEKRDFLRLLGADHIYDSRSLSFADEILTQTDGEGVDAVLNSLAGEAINSNLRVLKPFGRFLELGKRDFYENTRIGLRPFRNNISYFGIDADQMMQERPDLTGRLFSEVMALFTDGTLHPLPYHVFEAENIIDAFRFMQQARHIGKIVVTYRNGIQNVTPPAPSTESSLRFSPSASYLITGGLGGFGLRTAEWMVEKGAEHLVLISRSGPVSDEAKAGIERLQQQGATVVARACDVTDRKALEDLLASIAITSPPLKGVVHAAVVIDDGLINNLDEKQIQRVLEPKIAGAQYLHELTCEMELDHFILFSSATTLFGNPGQASYVAANGWLEALAAQRRAAGLPATCVRWGAIGDTGFLARNKTIMDALQNRMGGSAIPSAVALDTLESMLLDGRSGLGVMELDWGSLSRFLPSAQSPVYSEIARRASRHMDGELENNDDIQLLLSTLPDEELSARFVEFIKQDVGEILRIPTDKIDPARSIYDMGLDSLMGVELVVALETRFGFRLPVMALRENASITKLAEAIIEHLRAGDALGEEQGADATEASIAQLSQQHGVNASKEDNLGLAEQIRSSQSNTIIE